MARLTVEPGDCDSDEHLTAEQIADRLAHWGFLAHPDLPNRAGPAYLLVALRPVPTLEHFDPEAIDYWVTVHGRGERRTLSGNTPMPLSEPFSWGSIRLTDRLHVTNEYLTFGGRLDAADFGGVVMAAFTSPVPLLRRGGHSQGIDPTADMVGAFFGRLMVAVDYKPGFEALLAEASPIVRYAAFIQDRVQRSHAVGATDVGDEPIKLLVTSEEHRLRVSDPDAWNAAEEILAASVVADASPALGTSPAPPMTR